MSRFVEGRPMPPAVALLGYELISAGGGQAEVSFLAKPEFTNLMGTVQGGFVAAMLDATASTAILAELPPDRFAPTVEMKTIYLRPVPTGRLLARGRIVHRGGRLAFLEATLHDPDGTLLASATATAKITAPR